MYDTLAASLLKAHGMNEHGCLLTDYASIQGLIVQASTTNGTSGLGRYRGRSVYWHLDHGYRWNPETKDVKRLHNPRFVIELA